MSLEEGNRARPRIGDGFPVHAQVLEVHERVRHLRVYMRLVRSAETLHRLCRGPNRGRHSCVVLAVEAEYRSVSVDSFHGVLGGARPVEDDGGVQLGYFGGETKTV